MRVAVIGCMFGYRIDDKRNVTIVSANINTDNEPSVLEILERIGRQASIIQMTSSDMVSEVKRKAHMRFCRMMAIFNDDYFSEMEDYSIKNRDIGALKQALFLETLDESAYYQIYRIPGDVCMQADEDTLNDYLNEHLDEVLTWSRVDFGY